jgi:hypothetical protein
MTQSLARFLSGDAVLRQSGWLIRRRCVRSLKLILNGRGEVKLMQVLIQVISLIVAFGILAVLAVRPNGSRR